MAEICPRCGEEFVRGEEIADIPFSRYGEEGGVVSSIKYHKRCLEDAISYFGGYDPHCKGRVDAQARFSLVVRVSNPFDGRKLSVTELESALVKFLLYVKKNVNKDLNDCVLPLSNENGLCYWDDSTKTILMEFVVMKECDWSRLGLILKRIFDGYGMSYEIFDRGGKKLEIGDLPEVLEPTNRWESIQNNVG